MMFFLSKNSPKDFARMIFVIDSAQGELWQQVEKEIQDLTRRKEMWRKNKEKAEYEIANLTLALEKLEENKNIDGTIPEGVTLG